MQFQISWLDHVSIFQDSTWFWQNLKFTDENNTYARLVWISIFSHTDEIHKLLKIKNQKEECFAPCEHQLEIESALLPALQPSCLFVFYGNFEFFKFSHFEVPGEVWIMFCDVLNIHGHSRDDLGQPKIDLTIFEKKSKNLKKLTPTSPQVSPMSTHKFQTLMIESCFRKQFLIS